ncbi:SRPBCC family protein [Lacibacterium aquatile]|uniref:SRPBCC family protein n=1 Tax=Lacibacterium aquatile TaxID=1168082 RepID=A0ABW5DQR2_9PROT
MLTTILIIAAAVAGFLAFIATRPNQFRLERRTTIHAPADKIYELIADFRRWQSWSPYETKDPDMVRSFDGAAQGLGAVYSWQGDKNVGEGRMEILEAAPARRLLLSLDFFKPFKASNHAEFTLTDIGDGVTVTWAMFGPVPFFFRIFHLVCSMDGMVGKDFEAGLAKIKATAEG